VVGFIDGESCFYVEITESKTKIKKQVRIKLMIAQHIRDFELIKSFIEIFNCGYTKLDSKNLNIVYYYVTSFQDIQKNILPFFNLYPLQSEKRLDYINFVNVANLMENEKHLTIEGFNEILIIKSKMNRINSKNTGA